MLKKQFDFVKSFKFVAIIVLAVFAIGIAVSLFFGVKLDINFAGGSRFTYSYTGDVSMDEFEAKTKEILQTNVKISKSSDVSGNSAKITISVSGENAVSAEKAEKLTAALQEKFKDNKIAISETNTVNPSIAGNFFIRSLVAVALAAVLVIIYISLRFRNIGGLSAGVVSLITLLHDVFIAFFVCVVFRLEIDVNFIAVVLTLFGYSLNDTIVIFDRVRENRKYYSELTVRDCVNKSVNETLSRSITTSLTTFAAISTVAIVAEFFGLSSLRTFAIPMAIGVISGCASSIFLAGPMWVRWKEHSEKAKNTAE